MPRRTLLKLPDVKKGQSIIEPKDLEKYLKKNQISNSNNDSTSAGSGDRKEEEKEIRISKPIEEEKSIPYKLVEEGKEIPIMEEKKEEEEKIECVLIEDDGEQPSAVKELYDRYNNRIKCLRQSVRDMFELLNIRKQEVLENIDVIINKYQKLFLTGNNTDMIMKEYSDQIALVEAIVINAIPKEYEDYFKKNLETYMSSIYPMKHSRPLIYRKIERTDDIIGNQDNSKKGAFVGINKREKEILTIYRPLMPKLTIEQANKIIADYNVLTRTFTYFTTKELGKILTELKKEEQSNIFNSMTEIEALNFYKIMREFHNGKKNKDKNLEENLIDYLHNQGFYIPLYSSIGGLARNCWTVSQYSRDINSENKEHYTLISTSNTQAGPYNVKSLDEYGENMKNAMLHLEQQIQSVINNKGKYICFCNLCNETWVTQDRNVSKSYDKCISILRDRYKNEINILYFRSNTNFFKNVWDGDYIEETLSALYKMYNDMCVEHINHQQQTDNKNELLFLGTIENLQKIQYKSADARINTLKIALILVLCDKLGIENFINCKEGKDRTGLVLAMKLRISEWLDTNDNKLPSSETEWNAFYEKFAGYIMMNNIRIEEMLPGLGGTHNVEGISSSLAKSEYITNHSDNENINACTIDEYLFNHQHHGYLGKNGKEYESGIMKYVDRVERSIGEYPENKQELILETCKLYKDTIAQIRKEIGEDDIHKAKREVLIEIKIHLLKIIYDEKTEKFNIDSYIENKISKEIPSIKEKTQQVTLKNNSTQSIMTKLEEKTTEQIRKAKKLKNDINYVATFGKSNTKIIIDKTKILDEKLEKYYSQEIITGISL